MAETRMIVAKTDAAIGSQNYWVEIEKARHSLAADDPRTLGGVDADLAPYELLLSSLRACTAITSGDEARIDRSLTFEGERTDEQRERLADIAERTPVTLTLKQGFEIRTIVADPGRNHL